MTLNFIKVDHDMYHSRSLTVDLSTVDTLTVESTITADITTLAVLEPRGLKTSI